MEQHPRINLEAYFPCFFCPTGTVNSMYKTERLLPDCAGKDSCRTYFSYFRPAGRYYSCTVKEVLSLLFTLTFPVVACSGTVDSAVHKCPIRHWSGRQQRGWWQRFRKAEERKNGATTKPAAATTDKVK